MKIENLDHLGLVAALVDEIGLVELTDELLPAHPLNHISPGQVLKAMILNGLGFVSAPLYLFSAFFEGKPVEHLLGAGITASHLNDDRLGRVLDQVFEYGTTLFFVKVAMEAAQRFGVSVSQCHLDSTSFALDGEYATVGGSEIAPETEAPQAIEICRGYSRDHRPELKQFLVNLICSADGGIPVWFQVGSGNETDSQTFAGLMRAFAEQWETPALIVADAGFYSEPNLQAVGRLPWLSRVPQTLKAAQRPGTPPGFPPRHLGWGRAFQKPNARRCWVHKTVNVLNKFLKRQQPEAKRAIWEVYRADNKTEAHQVFNRFIQTYQAKYPGSTQCLAKDRDVLLTFFDFPAEHWAHIRTTNLIESTFATVRLRTDKTRGCVSKDTILALVFKLVESAQKSWLRIRGFKSLANVIEGVPFKDGYRVNDNTELTQQQDVA